MLSRQYLILCFALLLFLAACEMDDPIIPNSNDQMNNTTDTSAVSIVQLNIPIQIGNYWGYNYQSVSAVYND